MAKKKGTKKRIIVQIVLIHKIKISNNKFREEKKKGNLLTSSKKRDKKEDFSIVRSREEQWRKFGTVLVKRKGGQFISWGQID